MHAFGNILIYHPAAIGDCMLATPVATTLKLNFPAARLTYWTHASLRPILLGLCPAVDEVVDYVREASLFQQMKTFEQLQPDLFVDLSNSVKTAPFTWMTKIKVLRYEKQAPNTTPIKHATANFMDTIRPVCNEYPEHLFPTIFPDALAVDVLHRVLAEHNFGPLPLIGIVPGVGKLRPHRAWIYDGWKYLLQHILGWETHIPVLIGGSDEQEICAQLAGDLDGRCLNLAGQLTLPETAAVLKRCQLVVSGDTGPAHIAVAVGTRVVGLYGPTFPARSGPYGCLDIVVDQSRSCQCHDQKVCRYAPPQNPGECMHRIMLPEIIDRIKSELQPPMDRD
jgi:ADP-heptose:LPS heptosyltransferase